MKPIDTTTGVGRAVSALLGKTAETLTSTLTTKLFGRPRPAKRRRVRPAVAASRSRRTASAKKGGASHG